MTESVTIDDFLKLDIRVGKIIKVADFPEARKPAWQLTIDFGEEVGTKQSSAQITEHYSAEELMGRTVLGVVNLPPRQIAHFKSECLTLGVYDVDGKVKLANVDMPVPLGAKLC
jgi:tRNA-binding protein